MHIVVGYSSIKMLSRSVGIRVFIALLGIFSLSIVFSALSKNMEDIKRVKESFYQRKKDDTVKIDPDEDTNQKLIFVGGMPRSGTTLMRRMLESHPDIRCGPETHIIPQFLNAEHDWTTSPAEMSKLVEAGVSKAVLDKAIAKFILAIIVHHAPKADIYCNKDPYTLARTEYLSKLFPNAKFILMIRDGRAVAHSVVKRKIDIAGYDFNNYRDIIRHWSADIATMYKECLIAGPDVCLQVRYEQLVLRPVENTMRIFTFLGIPWRKEVLHHEQHVNDTHLSTYEASTNQVKKPLYLDALKSWCGNIPTDVERDLPVLAPMLQLLGYDPTDGNPEYGEPDDFLLGKLTL